MLVLTRKVGEVIVVGENIRVSILEIRGEQVRLGIVAPEEVTVDRAEIHAKRKNHRASVTSLPDLENNPDPLL